MTSFLQDTDSQSCPESDLHFDLKDLTTSTGEQEDTFRLQRESNPTRQARDIVSQIQNPKVEEQLDKLLSIIDKRFYIVQQEGVELSCIPPLHPHLDEDGSVLLEWIFPNFRIGFNIEPNPDDSGYHLVSNKKLGERTESEQLANMDKIVVQLLLFIRQQSPYLVL